MTTKDTMISIKKFLRNTKKNQCVLCDFTPLAIEHILGYIEELEKKCGIN